MQVFLIEGKEGEFLLLERGRIGSVREYVIDSAAVGGAGLVVFSEVEWRVDLGRQGSDLGRQGSDFAAGGLNRFCPEIAQLFFDIEVVEDGPLICIGRCVLTRSRFYILRSFSLTACSSRCSSASSQAHLYSSPLLRHCLASSSSFSHSRNLMRSWARMSSSKELD